MDRKDAIAWVLSICSGVLRKSQAKTLSVLVAAALTTSRLSLDWTDIRGLTTLMAAATVKGRSIPLLWASCPRNVWEGHPSRNCFEEALLLMLRALIPKELGVEVVILADRGFGRTEPGRFCQRHRFHYVIRIQPKVFLQVGAVKCRLDRYPVRRGCCFKLPGVRYRQRDPLTQHVVVRWKKGLPGCRDECWYLMTDLLHGARCLSDLYARRMGVEQQFRHAAGVSRPRNLAADRRGVSGANGCSAGC